MIRKIEKITNDDQFEYLDKIGFKGKDRNAICTLVRGLNFKIQTHDFYYLVQGLGELDSGYQPPYSEKELNDTIYRLSDKTRYRGYDIRVRLLSVLELLTEGDILDNFSSNLLDEREDCEDIDYEGISLNESIVSFLDRMRDSVTIVISASCFLFFSIVFWHNLFNLIGLIRLLIEVFFKDE